MRERLGRRWEEGERGGGGREKGKEGRGSLTDLAAICTRSSCSGCRGALSRFEERRISGRGRKGGRREEGGREEGGEARKGERESVQNQIILESQKWQCCQNTTHISLQLEHTSTCLGIFNYRTHLGPHMTGLPVLNLARTLPSDT